MRDETQVVRVLHAVGDLNVGGVETWLLHSLPYIDRSRFRMDFLVHTSGKGSYEDQVLRLGSKVIPCVNYRNPLKYGRAFRRVLIEHGPYDIVHSHVHHFGGIVLSLARVNGVPIRVAQ